MHWEDPDYVAALRAEIADNLLAEYGPEWYAKHQQTADADWEAALHLFRGLSDSPARSLLGAA